MSRRFAGDFEIDLDWKPEPEDGPQEDQSDGQVSPPLVPGAVNLTPYKGALTIIEYQTTPLQVEVIRDTDKFLMRFPFGGVKPDDPDPPNGSRRETREEVGLRIKLTQDNFVGELSGGPNCTIFIFAKRVPAEFKNKVKLGIEQKQHAAMLFDAVDRCIEQRFFSKNHVNAWMLFKRWRVGKSY